MSKDDNLHLPPLPLVAYADELVDKLREILPAAVKESDESSVHHARVATRRLKTAVDVFEPVSSRSHRKEFVKALRKLRQHLGPARDLDVMLGHLAEIKSEQLKSGVEWLTDQLTQRQKELRESEAEKFDVPKALARLGVWWGVRQDWADTGDGLESLIGESLQLQLDQFVEHADAVAGRAGAKTDAIMLDPHQVRIAGKALRYTLEMAVAGGHRLPAGVGRSFKRMQDALGLWHDYVVLSDSALKLSMKRELALHNPTVAAVVLDVAKLALRRSAKQMDQFNKLWNAKGEMLATTIRKAFPLTHPVLEESSELKTDLGPSDSEKPAEDQQATSQGEPSAA